jgi:hypothetical protein
MSLDIRGTKISSIVRGFGNLQNLVQLWGFPTNLQDNIGDWCSLGELGSLSKLKLLTTEGLEKAFSGSMVAEAKLSSKSHLTELGLKCGNILKDKNEVEDDDNEYHTTQIEEVFDDLRPPPCIQDILLTGYFGHRVPKWMARMAAFQNLRLLVIHDYPCCKQLPSGLSQIPFLDYIQILHAPSIESIGHAFLLPSGGDATNTDETSEITKTSTGTTQLRHLSCGVGVAFPKLRELVFDKVMDGWNGIGTSKSQQCLFFSRLELTAAS